MEADLVNVLRCPVCADSLTLDDRTARCARGHAYDVAKQGYLNLLPSASNGIEGDSAAMVGARTVFLGTGHYAPIRDALILRADLKGDDLDQYLGKRAQRGLKLPRGFQNVSSIRTWTERDRGPETVN